MESVFNACSNLSELSFTENDVIKQKKDNFSENIMTVISTVSLATS